MAQPTTVTAADLLSELIRFDTTNPPGNEGPCLEHIRGLFEGRGVAGRVLAGDPDRPNLVMRVPGRGEAPPLLLQGHVDVVTTEAQTWSRPPFGGEQVEGWVWGRGALDMKGGVAMMVTALLRGLDDGRPPAGDVVLACVADEEAGGVHGARYLVDEHPELFEGIRHGLGEGGGVRQQIGRTPFYPIMAAEKRACRLRMRLRGPGGHAARVHRGGTLAKLGRLLTALDEHRLPVRVDPLITTFVQRLAAQMPEPDRSRLLSLLDPARAEAALEAMGPEAVIFDSVLRNTLNATVVRAGGKVNVIPAEATVELDGRVLPGVEAREFIDEVRAIVGPEPEIEVTSEGPFQPEPELGTFFDLLVNTLDELDPEAIAVPVMLTGATDQRHFGRLGIVGYGCLPLRLPPEFGQETVHAADERVTVEGLDFGVRALERVLERYRG
jgi:acetylornithine deacetylase/succinyl-diaminopimelate desuccinylase-like protein